MRGILLLAVLNVKSSYSRDIETTLDHIGDAPDTLQWWFGDTGCWRIRTYAMDHDVHVYRVGNSSQTTLELARKNNLKHYGDQIRSQHVIHFVDCTSRPELDAEFARIGLAPRIQLGQSGFAFWKPDDEEYLTKSSPK